MCTYCFDKSRARYLNSSVQQQYQMSSTCQNPVSSCLATIALKANKSYSRALCILTPSFPTDNLLLKKCSVLKYLPRKKPLSPRLLSVVQRQMFLPLRSMDHWTLVSTQRSRLIMHRISSLSYCWANFLL